MTEVVNDVARSLIHSDFDCSTWPVELRRELVAFVIGKIREPTYAMENRGASVVKDFDKRWSIAGEIAGETWKAMIDEALK